MTYPMLFDRNIPAFCGFSADFRTIETSHVTAVHWHSFLEFEMVLDGSGMHRHQGKADAISRGDAWLMSCTNSHQLVCREKLRLVNVSFREEILDPSLAEFLTISGPLLCHFPEERCRWICAQAERLLAEYPSAPFSKLNGSAILTELLIALLRESRVETTMPPQLIQAAAAWAHRHYQQNASLSALAQEFAVSPNYLGMLFSHTTGLSFSAYVNNLRLRHACGLLLTAELTVKEIAFASGYRSVEHFCAVFRRQLHQTPTEYRQQLQQQ